MKFLAAQINPTVGAVAANAALVTDIWKRHKNDADLIIYPELVLAGYPPEDLVLKPAFMDAVEDEVKKICALTKQGGAGIALSTPWRIGSALYSAILLIDGGEITHISAKHHLPNYSVFDELRVFKPGPLPDPVDFRGVKLGLLTCEDMWFSDVTGELKSRGATVLIVPNGSPFEDGKTHVRIELARERVAETGLPLLYVNQVGGQDELVFDGCSFALNSDGTVAFQMKAFTSDCTVAELDVGIWKSAKNEAWPDTHASIFEALKLGLHDYVTKNGFPGVVLGLSGGIDSAIVAVVAAEALGADKLRCVMMPSPYTSQMSLDDAAELARNLGCAYDSIPIRIGMNAFNEMIGTAAQKGTTAENVQSRLRGMILMTLSNASGAMVLSTGNKSEMAVGYATLYGDMCGGYAVLKDLYKTQIYALAKWINSRAKKPLIPERIITRPPTAELKPNQTDQDSLPPYAVLDDILEGLIEYELRRVELIERGHDPEIVQKVWLMLDRAEYKRRQAAPGVKITGRAFGRDRRYPITNGFHPPLDEGHYQAYKDRAPLEKTAKTR